MSAILETSDNTPAPAWKKIIVAALMALVGLGTVGLLMKADGPHGMGQVIGRLLFVLIFAGVPVWLMTRKGSANTKANGAIVLAVVLLFSVLYNRGLGGPDKKVGAQFLNDAIALNEKHKQQFTALSARMTKIDLAEHLSPASITTAQGIARSRAAIADSRAFIAEREALLKKNLDEGVQLVNSLPPGGIRDQALAGAEAKRKDSSTLFTDINRAELAQLAAIEKVVDWCAAQGKKIRNDNGKFGFETQAQITQFKALVNELEKVELEVVYANTAFQRRVARAEEISAQGVKQAKEALAD